jgi:hypothetical protein
MRNYLETVTESEAVRVVRALDRLDPGALHNITRALRTQAKEHDGHAAVARNSQRAGGIPGFMTPEALGHLAQHHEHKSTGMQNLADLLDDAWDRAGDE